MSEPSAGELLARVRSVYAACRTYRDRGLAMPRTDGQGSRVRNADRRPFTTTFLRPDRLRFEWVESALGPEDEWLRWIVLANSQGVRSAFTLQAACDTHESIEACLGGEKAWASSNRVVLCLLLGIGGERAPFLGSTGGTVRSRVALDGRECFLVDLTPFDGRRRTLWIDARALVVRRIDEEFLLDAQGFAESSVQRDETTVSFEPELEGGIDPALFEVSLEALHAAARVPAEPRRPFVAPRPAPEGCASAATLLERVRTVYRTCRSYRDRGCVTTVSFLEGKFRGKYTDTSPFRTAFVRPARLRYAYHDTMTGPDEEEGLVIANEREVRSSFKYDSGIRTYPSILGALGTFAGVSGGSSVIVPCLLLPRGELADPLPGAETTLLLGLDDLEGRECFVLRGAGPGDIACTLWVGVEDSLLRRIVENHLFDETWDAVLRAKCEEELRQTISPEHRCALEGLLTRRFEPFRTETEITYEPELDVEISELVFAAPADWDAPGG